MQLPLLCTRWSLKTFAIVSMINTSLSPPADVVSTGKFTVAATLSMHLCAACLRNLFNSLSFRLHMRVSFVLKSTLLRCSQKMFRYRGGQTAVAPRLLSLTGVWRWLVSKKPGAGDDTTQYLSRYGAVDWTGCGAREFY